ncbi:GH1 family beta-glucosidase [Ktedonobacter robiniae]|uniref:Beta-glucosidase n=1 Tax=Ktedonobacter robiniae TaxID=2778365 RepID=A0ABQ3V4F2_9CHLR|nr:GH1 family beta-glucosidase [Ktedonobacter robiniae]GHO59642.1 beta-glucosidase [Ktedonobacter robiniae]
MSSTEQIQTLSSADLALARAFPKNFVWGAATAAYQIEGATQEDGREPSIWDMFAAIPGKVHQGDNGAIANNHYHLMQEDVELMSRLGLGGYRFSIAWPRIIPQGRGAVNAAGLDFYDRLVDTLLTKGITPFATLYHWDLPLALHQEGGWTNRDTAYAYADYAEIVARRLGDRVAGWMTLNEPWCSAYLGYGIGIHAPGEQDLQQAIDAGHHLLLAHGLALPRLRANSAPNASVGISLNFTPIYPADERAETLRDAERADLFVNRWFIEPLARGQYPGGLFAALEVEPPPVQAGDLELIGAPIDFLGVNNYTRDVVRGGTTPARADESIKVGPVPGACYTEMGWEIYPQALTDLLIRLHREYGMQALYIMENGAAFKDSWDGGDQVHDPRRVAYMQEYIGALASALEQGAPVRGYFVWSLMDNFEWAEGYAKRFGIVYVDYQTQRRIIKDSGLWYSALLEAWRANTVL